MIESDSRLLKTLAAVDERPLVQTGRLVREAVALLQSAPRIGHRSDAIVRARSEISDARTKLVDKKITVMRERALLRDVASDLNAYLQAKYINHLGSVKNKQGRDALVTKALSPITRRIDKLNSAFDVIEEVIRDYDSRAYGVRDVISALQRGEREA